MDAGTAEQVRELIAKGTSAFTVGSTTDDARKTYAELKAKGGRVQAFVRHRLRWPGPVRQPRSVDVEPDDTPAASRFYIN